MLEREMRTKLIMLISKQYSHRQLILLQYRKIREDPRRYQICTHTHTHTHTHTMYITENTSIYLEK